MSTRGGGRLVQGYPGRVFRNRIDAGAELAQKLLHLREESPVVVGLARGGVPVAHEIAVALEAPLDVLVVRKIGAPGREEFALGAIGEGARVMNDHAVAALGVSPRALSKIEERERRELQRRTARYRNGRPPVDLRGRTVIVVDDGIATGASAVVACQIVHQQQAAKIVLAVPVAPADWTPGEAAHVDEFVAALRPRDLSAIGQWYEDFSQVSDAEVIDIFRSSQ